MAQSDQIEINTLNKINKLNGRVLRSRQYKRLIDENRPIKRLFTPEIKRHLKTWLIRRRENPYPNREEKKELAAQTGLTYIQICNWFANWRRKLKNSSKNVNRFTWSTLIKSYNDQVLGNVEHLSINSDDSIWEEPDSEQYSQFETDRISSKTIDHCYTSQIKFKQDTQDLNNANDKLFSEEQLTNKSVKSVSAESLPQCFQISSTTDFISDKKKVTKERRIPTCNRSCRSNTKLCNSFGGSKKKKSTPDKNWNYRKMIEEIKANSNHIIKKTHYKSDSSLLLKWRKSAALFHPCCKNYTSTQPLDKKNRISLKENENFHGREELDAAEALTFLSRASLSRF